MEPNLSAGKCEIMRPTTTNECLRLNCCDCDHVDERNLEIDKCGAVIHCEVLREMMRAEEQHDLQG